MIDEHAFMAWLEERILRTHNVSYDTTLSVGDRRDAAVSNVAFRQVKEYIEHGRTTELHRKLTKLSGGK